MNKEEIMTKDQFVAGIILYTRAYRSTDIEDRIKMEAKILKDLDEYTQGKLSHYKAELIEKIKKMKELHRAGWTNDITHTIDAYNKALEDVIFEHLISSNE